MKIQTKSISEHQWKSDQMLAVNGALMKRDGIPLNTWEQIAYSKLEQEERAKLEASLNKTRLIEVALRMMGYDSDIPPVKKF